MNAKEAFEEAAQVCEKIAGEYEYDSQMAKGRAIRACIAAIRARAALEPDGWMPIASAPKDGSSFIAVSGQWITTCHWHRLSFCWATCGPTYERYPIDEQPEYWQPLPAPPERPAVTL